MRVFGFRPRSLCSKAVLRLLLALVVGLWTSPLVGQSLVWSARYDSGGDDVLPRGRAFRVDPSGGVTLAGQAGTSVFLARYQPDGTAGPSRIQITAPPFAATSVFIDEQDRAAVSGYKATGSMAGDTVPLLMRFGFAGDPETLFEHFVGPLEGWTGRQVVGSGDGGLILNYDLVGHAFLQGDFVQKIGGTGPSWSLSSGGNLCYPLMIAPDPLGGALVGLNGSQTTVARFNPSGAQAWKGACTDTGWLFAGNPSVGVVDAAGVAWVSGRGPTDRIVTARIDPIGNVEWARSFEGKGPGPDAPVAIATDLSGAVVVAGSTTGPGGGIDFQLVRYDAAGRELWAQAFDGGGDDQPAGLALDAAGNAWITGASGNEVLTLKYDPSGALRFSHRFAAPAAPTVAGVAVDGWGNATVVFAAAGDVFVLRYGEAPTRVGPLRFMPVTPCRAFDSRTAGLGGPDPLQGPSDHVIALADVCGIPAGARAVSLNLTVTGGTRPGNLVFFPAGQQPPLSSSINYSEGQTRANNATVGLGTGTGLGLRVNQGGGTVHVLVDVAGYWN